MHVLFLKMDTLRMILSHSGSTCTATEHSTKSTFVFFATYSLQFACESSWGGGGIPGLPPLVRRYQRYEPLHV